MSNLWDNPRPPGYWPNTPSQWREPSVDDCTWYSTEFLFEAASENHLSMHPVQELRNKSTDTEGGTPLDVALRDTLRIWPTSERVTYIYGAYSREFIVTALRRGAGILWGGDYENLPAHYRRWTYNDVFNHAMASLRLDVRDGRERTFLYDPLGGGPQRDFYDGEWISIDNILKFSWDNGSAANPRYYVGVVENLGELPMKKLYLPTSQDANRVVRVARGAECYVAPRTTATKVRRFWNEETWRPMLGSVGGGWRIVMWDDKEGDTWDYGYVHVDRILEVQTVNVGDTDCDALRAANEELQRQNTELNLRMDKALIEATEVVDALS